MPPTTPPTTLSYCSDDGSLRWRSVGQRVLHTTVSLAPVSAGLLADWQRDADQRIGLQSGDVEALSLARARARRRWPDYARCVQAAARWTQELGWGELLAASDQALMACRGARYHHDGAQYGDKAFCNLFLTEDSAADLHFPAIGQRIPLVRGTLVVFDTAQPHAVLARGARHFDAADFADPATPLQVFLTWELPIALPAVAQALGVVHCPTLDA